MLSCEVHFVRCGFYHVAQPKHGTVRNAAQRNARQRNETKRGPARPQSLFSRAGGRNTTYFKLDVGGLIYDCSFLLQSLMTSK